MSRSKDYHLSEFHVRERRDENVGGHVTSQKGSMMTWELGHGLPEWAYSNAQALNRAPGPQTRVSLMLTQATHVDRMPKERSCM